MKWAVALSVILIAGCEKHRPADTAAALQEPQIQAHQGAVRSLAFASGGARLATLGEDGWVRLWSASDLAKVGEWNLPNRSSVQPDTAGNRVMLVGKDHALFRYTASAEQTAAPERLSWGEEALESLASPDGSAVLILTAKYSRLNGVNSSGLWQRRLDGDGPMKTPAALVWSGDGEAVAASDTDLLRVWSVTTGAVLLEAPRSARPRRIQLGPNGAFALVLDDNGVQRIEPEKAAVKWDVETPADLLLSVDGARVAMLSADGRVRVRKVPGLELLAETPKLEGVSAWSWRGNRIALGTRSGALVIRTIAE